MVFGPNGQAFVGRKVARAVGASPTQKHPIELKPKIIMQTSRVMFLDDELMAARFLSARPRLVCSRKISLLAIGLEPVGIFRRHLKWTGADFARILARTARFPNTTHRAPRMRVGGSGQRIARPAK